MFDKQKLEQLRAALEKYQEAVEKTLKKMPERRPEFVNTSGIPVERVYTPLDLEDYDYLEKLGMPGQYPYTRAVQPTAYRGRFWTMRQYAGFGSAEETNQRYHYLLQAGQTGLSVAFDLPTQIGYDSDHELAQGEVGKVGVAIDSLWDMETLFQGIPLDKVSTSMTINSPAAILMAMYLALAENQGIPFDQLRGTIQNDILKEYPSRGTYIFPPRPSMRIITDIFAYCSQEVPQWNSISISGYHIREAGSTAVQEVAFTLANGFAYVEAAIQAGLDVDVFGPRLSFFFNSHNDFFEEAAKFRAARRLWARVMKERFGAKNPRSLMLRFHTQTAGCTLTAQQPLNNIVRVAFQAMSAVLGGTQSLHTNSMDEALALPSELAVQVALRTQQLIAHETGVTDTVDPLAGSYYVEKLTDEIEAKAQEYIDTIEKMGGPVAAIEKGYIQKEIQESAYRYQKEIESGERIIVGLNKYQVAEERPKELLRVDPTVREKQIARLSTLKSQRDAAAVTKALQEVKQAAQTEANLMPPILQAVKSLATLGEICNVLREVFGEYEAAPIV
ncbi:MAG: methylmalonyl-CoA mutase family protein [Deltaproteobacteria bacterium]|nr:methylmalonyl-CoA mutase family protein [Deltaproteobacteria bacterium]MBW1951968.1 methylmalonyl-CoA mutase family protein [Deltaproteobacteria bacterium]MBW1986744.1 methylmalonyl-CoA mutase family protein [Deltaproteobacteria bacterium]MBW2134271.1 methylmalonyl-CoA mutase family protein [Deltaproteobacteria bacterium]